MLAYSSPELPVCPSHARSFLFAIICLSCSCKPSLKCFPNLIPEEGGGEGYMAHTLNGMITQQSIGHVQRRRERKDEALGGKIPSCHNMLGGGCRISEGQTRSPAIIMSFGAAKLCGVSIGEGSDRY